MNFFYYIPNSKNAKCLIPFEVILKITSETLTLCGKYYKFMYCCLHLFILYLGRTLSVNWKTLFLIDSCTKVLQNKNLNRELCFDQKLFNGRKKLEHPCHGMHIILCMCVVMYVCIYCFVLESCRLPGV
jgi:hypothetical protein